MDGYLDLLTQFGCLAVMAAVNALPLCLIVGLISRFGQKWISARIRFHLWTLVLVRMLLPVSIESPIGLGNFPNYLSSIRPAQVSTEPITQIERSLPMPIGIAPTQYEKSFPELEVASWSWRSIFVTAFQVLGVAIPFASLLFICWFLTTSLRLWRRVSQGSSSPNADWAALIEEGRRTFGIRAAVRIRVLEGWKIPATMGFFRPIVLLPDDANSLSETELKHVVWHELAHVRRGDAGWNWIWIAVCCFQCWNPVFWWAQRRWVEERELACDALAMSHLGICATDYGRTLLDFLERLSDGGDLRRISPLPGFVCLIGDKAAIQRRLIALANPISKESRTGRWIGFALIGLVAAAGLSDASESNLESPYPKAIMIPAGTVWEFGANSKSDLGDSNAPTSTRVYNLEKVLKRIQQDVPVANARWDVVDLIQRFYGLCELVDGKPRNEICTFNGNEMTVIANEVQHRKIHQVLAHWEQFGQQQIAIEVRLLSTKKELNYFVPTSSGRILSPASTREIDLLSSFEQGQSIRQLIACPSFVRKMSANDADSAIRILQGEPMNWLFAPKVTIFSGSTACIRDIKERPYLTGLKTDSEGQVETQVSKVAEGVEFAINAFVASSSGEIDLDFQMRHSEITDVEVLTARIDGQSRESKIQIPHVSELSFRIATKLGDGQSLLVAPLRRDRDGNLHLFLISPQILNLK